MLTLLRGTVYSVAIKPRYTNKGTFQPAAHSGDSVRTQGSNAGGFPTVDFHRARSAWTHEADETDNISELSLPDAGPKGQRILQAISAGLDARKRSHAAAK